MYKLQGNIFKFRSITNWSPLRGSGHGEELQFYKQVTATRFRITGERASATNRSPLRGSGHGEELRFYKQVTAMRLRLTGNACKDL